VPIKAILAWLDPKFQMQPLLPVETRHAKPGDGPKAAKRRYKGSIRRRAGWVYVCVLTGNSGSPSRPP